MTASRFNKLPSEIAGIVDPSIAQAFDIECADVLFQWELDQEEARTRRQTELLAGEVVMGAFGQGSKSRFDETNAERW